MPNVIHRVVMIWTTSCFHVLPFVAGVAPCEGQSAERAVTLSNGLQYQGQVASVEDYGVSLAASHPLNTKPIVLVDDGLRRVFFHNSQIGPLIADVDRSEIEFEIWQRALDTNTSGAGNIVHIGPFDEYGHRTFTVRDADNRVETFTQGITKITPRYCVVQTLLGGDYKVREWTMNVATSSIDPAVIRALLRRQITNPDKPNEYLAIVEFFLQSEQYLRALEELELIRNKTPELKEQFEPIRLRILAEYGRQLLSEAQLRMNAGQRDLAVSMIRTINKEEMSEELKIELAQVESDSTTMVETAIATRINVSEFVKDYLAKQSGGEEQREILREFLNELETDSSPTNVDRLAAFSRVAADPTQSSEQQVALALSGWLLGSNNAIDNAAVALSLWPVRALAREYLTTDNLTRRSAILEELSHLEGGEPQYLAKMIGQMLPLNPPDLGTYDGHEPLRLTFEIPGTKFQQEKPQQIDLLVQLPPQYDPYRRYPCILTLPGQNEAAEQLLFWTGDFNNVLKMRQGHAGRYGFIIASVDWKIDGQNAYGFSAREHLTILRAARELLRRFAIDSDRLFLAGHFEGARAAFDVAISHPDQFAGVIGVSGGMGKYIDVYADNKHVGLPVYVVCGQRDQFRADMIRNLNLWLRSREFNELTLVEYQGRMAEMFFEEVPEMLKWCQSHRRKLPRAGEEFEMSCKTLRPWDNYFWFWELKGIPADNIKFPEEWVERGLDPLKITATLRAGQPNLIRVGPSNAGSGGVLWLSPDLVDFSKEIEVGERGEFKGFVKPSAHVILDDVRIRGDRQHPFWAKLVCEGKKWRSEE